VVSVILVSHSDKLVQGLKEICLQMAPQAKIYPIGGTADGDIGSDYDRIFQTFCEVDEAIVFFDLGSSLFTSQLALEAIDEEKRSKILIMDTPMVESAIEATVQASIGETLENIVQMLDGYKMGKI